MNESCVTTKGQLVIPAALRRRYHIKAGTRVRFLEKDGEIAMIPLTRYFIRSMAGVLRSGQSVTAELLQERARDTAREEVKYGRRHSR
jgi:AbrB family looped-hinge helix DNA binding protein